MDTALIERPGVAARAAPGPAPRLAMTIDVEDWFQVWAMEPHIARANWEGMELRVVASTHRLLDLLAEHGRQATFFTLGWVAERCPLLIRQIVACGHELASHGHDHALVTRFDRAGFKADVAKAKAILEDVGGVAVQGYRAPSFSMGLDTPWAWEVLAETGHRYSSSSHPTKNDHYGRGMNDRRPQRRDGIVELPVSTLPWRGRNLPCAGGGYFRLLPELWTRFAIDRLVRDDTLPVVFYLHPWEVDPGQPMPEGLPFKTRLRHYRGLETCAARLGRLLARHPWGRMDAVVNGLQIPSTSTIP